MPTVKILQKEDPLLRQKTAPVPVAQITTPKIKKIIASMITALEKEEDGVAIAAPQIGVSLSIFIVSGRVFEMMEKTPSGKTYPHLICINPEILKSSKSKKWLDEGCLSVRWLYGKVERSDKTKIRAHDEHGKVFTLGGSGLLAQIFQHETDHLNGTLFIDKAKDVVDIPPEEVKK